MRYQVIFRPVAREQAMEAARYIADQGYPENTLRWYDGLERAVASLAKLPRRCAYARERDKFPGAELRQLIYKSHRLIFAINENEVYVLYVRHVAQDDLGASTSDEDA